MVYFCSNLPLLFIVVPKLTTFNNYTRTKTSKVHHQMQHLKSFNKTFWIKPKSNLQDWISNTRFVPLIWRLHKSFLHVASWQNLKKHNIYLLNLFSIFLLSFENRWWFVLQNLHYGWQWLIMDVKSCKRGKGDVECNSGTSCLERDREMGGANQWMG